MFAEVPFIRNIEVILLWIHTMSQWAHYLRARFPHFVQLSDRIRILLQIVLFLLTVLVSSGLLCDLEDESSDRSS